jgi:hypothetical protein
MQNVTGPANQILLISSGLPTIVEKVNKGISELNGKPAGRKSKVN